MATSTRLRQDKYGLAALRAEVLALWMLGMTMFNWTTAAAASPETVYFRSGDGSTELVGYLFQPTDQNREPHPAIVMLHGRGGPYSRNVNARCGQIDRNQASPCNADTLSQRHKMWGKYWAGRGYLALHVDSFGPRGRAHGYGRHSHDWPERKAVNEITVRPLDAEAALAYLSARTDVQKNRILLQGWSNGGSTALNVMHRQAQGQSFAAPLRFRAALIFYPGCGVRSLLSQHTGSDAEVHVFLAANDEEVSPLNCVKALQTGVQSGLISVTQYPGATHDFDDPERSRQANADNQAAKEDAMKQAGQLADKLSMQK